MTSQPPSYHGYRFPPGIISHAVWLYRRFCLSFRDTEDLLAQRGIIVSYEAIGSGVSGSVLGTLVSCGAGRPPGRHVGADVEGLVTHDLRQLDSA